LEKGIIAIYFKNIDDIFEFKEKCK